jgi:two-component sensor histidine kinase
LHKVESDLVLSVEDNGVGLPAERRAGAMGMRLIEGMARGLGGVLTVDGDQRTLITVRFPLTSNS